MTLRLGVSTLMQASSAGEFLALVLTTLARAVSAGRKSPDFVSIE